MTSIIEFGTGAEVKITNEGEKYGIYINDYSDEHKIIVAANTLEELHRIIGEKIKEDF